MLECTMGGAARQQRRSTHAGAVFWLTGLSGAGKSTLATGAEYLLRELGYKVCVLDGDRLRMGLNRDLGFSDADRMESMRRAGEIAALLADTGLVVIVALISPLRAGRQSARQMIADGRQFHEVYVAADLRACEARDPKGLYRKARAGEIANFTGISSRYEVPEQPDLVIDTCAKAPVPAIDELVGYVVHHITGVNRSP